MRKFRVILAAVACTAFFSVCLAGCGGQDVKQDRGSGGKGLSAGEKQGKKGD